LGVEIGLLTTLEECTDPQQQLSNLDATYPYYSHASLALSYIFALRTASDLQQLDPSLNSTFLSLQRQVQVAALRLKQDQANKALLTEELRNEDDFQKRLKQVSSTVQGEIAVRMACDPLVPGEHAEERQQMLTRAQRILAVSNDDPATGLTAEDLSAEAAAIMPRADPAKLKKLRRFTEEALSRHPDIPRLRYALALVEMRQGDVEHAISNLKIVTSLDSDNPEAHFALGYAYFQAGNGDAGTEEWGYARVLDPARWQLRTENPVYTCALKTAPVYAQSRAASRDAGTRKHLP
jgi:tetratricopeptide (TPR) repeat protein